ncbi:MAG: peptidoglycan bridge formation glycyltransferase FemA/FemB family protein, partial [Anaerolineales bacterium]|nr:peptidoglycan bridge formation glycyltransferase FemA/FemB family protein [Anaerolineales bacterium]
MSELSLNTWNTFLANSPHAHLLQTGEWGELKSAFGWEAVRIVAGEVGAQILFRRLPLGFTLAYMPKGPVFSNQSSVISDQFWAEVDEDCRARHAIFLKIEPDDWDDSPLLLGAPRGCFAKGPGVRSIPHNIQPPRTIVIDLCGKEDEILARMKQKTRYNIRLAEKKGVAVRAWDDVAAFHRIVLATGERDVFGVHSLEYYRRSYNLFHEAGMCEMLVAEYEGRPLAALMVFARGKRAWYFYGASSDEARNLMPTYLLQWEAMRWAKARGCEEYDLWGVPDGDEETLETQFSARSDGLWGVYRFKRGFGGEVR